MAPKGPDFDKLGPNNYPQWSGEMEAWLRASELWRLVSGTLKRPADATKPEHKEAVETKQEDWDKMSDKAGGWLFLMVEPEQRVHFDGIKDDPVKIWKKLEDVHMVKKAGARFNAYDDLFSIRKKDEESLQSLTNRITLSVRKIQNLRPADFTLEKLDEELLSMAMIRALPSDYANFVSSILLMDKLDKDTIIQAFQNEENQRTHRSETESGAADKVLAASTLQELICEFCHLKNHLMKDCFKYEKAKKEARKPRPKKAANTTAAQATAHDNVKEFAGKVSFRSTTPSTPEINLDWNADTGATSHMTPHRTWLRNYQPYRVPIRLADDTVLYSAGVGNVVYHPLVDGRSAQPIELTRVLHVPLLGNNLLAVLFLTKRRGFEVHIDADLMNFIKDGKKLFVAKINDHNTAYLSGTTQSFAPQSVNMASTLPMDYSLWHRRFAHLNLDDVKLLIGKEWVTGVTLDSKQMPDPVCEPCLAGKMHANPFPTTGHRATQPLELVHSDVHGPTPVQSHSGYRYWATFLDDATRFKAVIPMKRKSDTFAAFLVYKAYAERLLGVLLKILRHDKGGEYISKEFLQYCADHGITIQQTVRNRPQQNGDAERLNRVGGERITTMLSESGLPPQFWADCLASLVHVWNCSPTSALKGMTPYEAWHKKKPDVSHLRVWGCTAYVHIQKDKRKQFGPRMEKCVFIGYPEGYKGWKFYNPITKKCIISERADFDERYFPGLRRSTAALPPDTFQPPNVPSFVDLQEPGSPEAEDGNEELPDLEGDEEVPQNAKPPIQDPVPPLNNPIPQAEEDIPPANDPQPPSRPPSPLPPPARPAPYRRSNPPRKTRTTRSLNETHLQQQNAPPPVPFAPPAEHNPSPPLSDEESEDELLLRTPDHAPEDAAHAAMAAGLDSVYDQYDYLSFDQLVEELAADHEKVFKAAAHSNEPKSFKEAMGRPEPERSQWYKAAVDEIQALVENGTFELVQLPPGRKAIGSRWVFKVKRNADGSIERHKGRLVAQGFGQRPGFDFTETFAPTPKWAALRAILAIAAIEDLELESVDISSAYLNGELKEEVYMKQPEGFEERGPNWYWHLLKSLYGLKQAGRCWHEKLNSVLEGLGFKRVTCEHSIWVYLKDDVRIIIPVFIDDMTIAAKSKAAIQG
jgi:transposase InsO family protein